MFGENCGPCSPGGEIGANLQLTGSSPLNWWGSVGKRPGPVMSVEKQAEVGIQHSQSRFLQRWVLGGFHGGGGCWVGTAVAGITILFQRS